LDELVNYVGSLNIPLEMKVNGRYVWERSQWD
jgi:hypothetical protein